ncbi:C1q-like domain-containing protein, partial [Salmonella sp. s54925]|uniref:C1q-like domain-containing protein n=1 Tax=Salmonella sp. s54925 TaxID=3159674 RepID=UPI0039813136
TTAAFFATLTSGSVGPNYAGDSIKFNDVSINIGDVYNPTTGKFQAPMDGIYEFHFSVLQRKGYQSYVYLMKDGAVYTKLHANHKNYDILSKTVLMLLKKDQNVWVRLPKDSRFAIYGGERYSTFSGHLI